MKRTALLLLVLAAVGGAAAGDEVTRLAPASDAIGITGDTVLEQGTWLVTKRDGKGVLRIATDDVTLDLGGATLRGASADASPDELTSS